MAPLRSSHMKKATTKTAHTTATPKNKRKRTRGAEKEGEVFQQIQEELRTRRKEREDRQKAQMAEQQEKERQQKTFSFSLLPCRWRVFPTLCGQSFRCRCNSCCTMWKTQQCQHKYYLPLPYVVPPLQSSPPLEHSQPPTTRQQETANSLGEPAGDLLPCRENDPGSIRISDAMNTIYYQ